MQTFHEIALGRPCDSEFVSLASERWSTFLGKLRLWLSLTLSLESRRKRNMAARSILSLLYVLGFSSHRVKLETRKQTVRTQDYSGVNIVGYVRSELGLGEGARNTARSLRSRGISFGLTDVGFQTDSRNSDKSIVWLGGRKDYPIDIYHVNGDQLFEVAEYMSKTMHAPARAIGFWAWEQTRVPATFLRAANFLDEIWVPSQFVSEALAPYVDIAVRIVPHAVVPKPVLGIAREIFGLGTEDFVFLTIFDPNSQLVRKNPMASIRAFVEGSRTHQQAKLVVKTVKPKSPNPEYEEVRKYALLSPKIKWIDYPMTRLELSRLQSRADAYISLHRAEGFGLPLAEMMGLGKPVISTGWSGNCDFMNDSNSYLVRYVLRDLARDAGPYTSGLPWAEADIEHGAEFVHNLLSGTCNAAQVSRNARNLISRKYSYEEVGRQMQGLLADIAKQPHRIPSRILPLYSSSR